MKNHYIPRLLLRPFAKGERINTFNFASNSFENKKLKNTFSEDDLFNEELEKIFANKLEGPFGNLLNHKLLNGGTITLNRQENLLLRKFLLINFLRAPIVNNDWDEMVKRTELQDHPSVKAREFLLRHHPELKSEFDKISPSKEQYIANLKKVMEVDSLEDLAMEKDEYRVSKLLRFSAIRAMISVTSFWDVSETGCEFIMTKLPGITEMDNVSRFYKSMVMQKREDELQAELRSDVLNLEMKRLQMGSALFSENYAVYPISPTRCIICFSPYFRAFFPIMDATGTKIIYPPFLDKEQFDRHFYDIPRMNLFQPCNVCFNQIYTYTVKSLTEEELYHINSAFLNMETEEFAFNNKNSLIKSFKYYDDKATFAFKKKHDFSKFY